MESKPLENYSLAVVNSHPIQYFAPLYRRLAAEPGIELTVYYCSRAGVRDYEDEGFGTTVSWDVPLLDGYRHKFIPNLRNVEAPAGFWSLGNVPIVPELRRAHHDAVWVHGHNYLSHLLAVLAAKAGGSELFMRCETHLGLDRPFLRRLLRKPVMMTFYRLFDGLLAIGSRNAEFYRSHGVSDDKIFPVPYVVDNEFFCEESRPARDDPETARGALDLPAPDVPVVLYLSKLRPRKRPMDLLRAFERFRERSTRRAALAFVGDGSERGRLGLYVEDRGVPDVHFLGFRNQSEVPAIYGVSDVLVLPSENEPWGLVVNEAMCAGLPVIVSDDVGAAADLVSEGENGFVVPVRDVERLAGRLGRLLADRELRRRMGKASREIIAEWDLDACVEGVRTALRSACGSLERGTSERARSPAQPRSA